MSRQRDNVNRQRE